MRVVSALVLASGLLLAASVASVARADDSDTKVPLATFSGGDTAFDVSVAGNVSRFESPTGYNHLGPGNDGYVLCYRDPATQVRRRVFDVGFDSGWAATHTSVDPVRTRRDTTDGRFRLRQRFAFDAGTRSLTVRMRLTNLSAVPISSVSLQRYTDLDVDYFGDLGWAIDFGNAAFATQWFSHDAESVRSWQEASSAPPGKDTHTVVVRSLQGAVQSRVVDYQLPLRCDPTDTAPDGALQGDRISVLRYPFGTIPPGSTRQVKIRLTRIQPG